jgi:hypothetical protein
VGYEAGLIKRLMDENLLSWGYFPDHNPFEPHCNAHPNNFLVLDLLATTATTSTPSSTITLDKSHAPTILAPLDFDMAYEFGGAAAFVSTLEDVPETYGK